MQITAGTTYSLNTISMEAKGQILSITDRTQSIQITNLEVGKTTTCQITLAATKKGQGQHTTLAHSEARASVSKIGHAVHAEEKKGSKEEQLWRTMCQITLRLATRKRRQAQLETYARVRIRKARAQARKSTGAGRHNCTRLNSSTASGLKSH